MKYAAALHDESIRAGLDGGHGLAPHTDPFAAIQALQRELLQARAEARRVRQQNLQLTLQLRLRPAQLQQPSDGAPPLPRLTTRESEVLFWIAQGKTNEETSRILDISLSTVKKHLANVFDKLGVDNRTAAAHAARQQLLVAASHTAAIPAQPSHLDIAQQGGANAAPGP